MTWTGLDYHDWLISTVEQVIMGESMGGVVTLGMALREDITFLTGVFVGDWLVCP